MDVRFEKDISSEFMVIDSQADSKYAGYEAQVLHNNEIPGLMKFKIRESDGQIMYYYDIKGFKSLSDGCEFEDVDYRAAVRLMDDIRHMLGGLEDYLLSCDSVCLASDFIFRDVRQNHFLFIYVPGQRVPIRDQLRDLLGWLMKHINYSDKSCVSYVFELYRKIENDEDIFAEDSPQREMKVYPKGVEEVSTEGEGSTPSIDGQEQEKTPETGKKTGLQSLKWKWVIRSAIISLLVLGAAVLLSDNLSLWMRAWLGIYPPSWIWILIVLILGILSNLLVFYFSMEREDKDDDTFWEDHEAMDFSAMKMDETTTLVKENEYPQTQLLRERCLVLVGKSEACRDVIYVRNFPFTIGKNKAIVQHAIEMSTISRRHVQIQFDDGKYYATDLYSTNGTMINGRSLPPGKACEIKPGDNLRIAELEFDVQENSGEIF